MCMLVMPFCRHQVLIWKDSLLCGHLRGFHLDRKASLGPGKSAACAALASAVATC